MRVATHPGPFHADDVFAYALLRVFLDAELELTRTRDLHQIGQAELAIDVGGEYDAARGRFDHHQRSYQGPLSSAGMVLNWLEHTGKLSVHLAAQLRRDWVEYIDDIDNGRRHTTPGLPCISVIVAALAEQAHTPADFDRHFLEAAALCEGVLRGLLAVEHSSQEAKSAVLAAMRRAEAEGSRVIVFERHYKWKRAYFELGGAHHPSDFVLFPDDEGGWRLLGIPDDAQSLGVKRPLPAEWAGLVDEELCRAVGVAGATFCHKKRFLAVFSSEAAARAAIERWGLDRGPMGVGSGEGVQDRSRHILS